MIEGEPERAATLLGASEALFSELGVVPSPDETESQQRVTDYVVDAFGAERVAELRAEGAGRSVDELLDRVASEA
jgi:hypothetical protein